MRKFHADGKTGFTATFVLPVFPTVSGAFCSEIDPAAENSSKRRWTADAAHERFQQQLANLKAAIALHLAFGKLVWPTLAV
jgi:hypothetical protein